MKKSLCRLMCVFITFIITVLCQTVTVSAASAKLNKSGVELPVGYSVTVKASGTDKELEWTSKDTSVASVMSSDGNSSKIAGVKTGSTYIYAKADGVNLKCKVTVKNSFISASKDDIELEKGGAGKITLTVKGSKKIALSNSGKDVCSVSWGKWNGDKITLTVKAKKNGEAKLTVYAKGHKKSTAETIDVEVDEDYDKYIDEDSDDDDNGKKTDRSKKENKDKDDGSSVAEDVIKLVNKEREKEGKNALISDSILNKLAAQRAEEISGKFSHTRPDGSDVFSMLADNGIKNVYAGENIAGGYPSAKAAVEGWMNSVGHKANILSDNYTRIGVGLYKADDKLGYYWVQVFTSDY